MENDHFVNPSSLFRHFAIILIPQVCLDFILFSFWFHNFVLPSIYISGYSLRLPSSLFSYLKSFVSMLDASVDGPTGT